MSIKFLLLSWINTVEQPSWLLALGIIENITEVQEVLVQ